MAGHVEENDWQWGALERQVGVKGGHQSVESFGCPPKYFRRDTQGFKLFSEASVKAVTQRVPSYPELTLGESLAAGKAYSTEP